MFDLELKYPGFGGFGVDSLGVQRVWVGNAAQAEAAVTDIRALRSAGRRGAPGANGAATSIVGTADFSISVLARVRDVISNELLDLTLGIIGVGIDGATNRVEVEVLRHREASAREIVEARLSARGLPLNAHTLRVTSLAVPDVAPLRDPGFAATTVNATLDDPNIPVVGGVRLGLETLQPCTLGLVVSRSGALGSISNSHCSPTLFGLDVGYQAYNGNVYHFLGGEQVDPSALSSAACAPYSALPCRYSDANFTLFEDSVQARRGAIARPLSYSSSWGTGGTLSVDQTLRFFAVTSVAQPGTVLPGDYLMKVGHTTGWTEGVVQSVCHDQILSDGGLRKCSIKSRYYASGGDSGGPVFLSTNGSAVMIVGIHYGSRPEDQITFSSHWHRVVGELGGTIVATTDISVAPPVVAGTLPGGLPELSWAAVTTSNTILSTTYRIYRSTFDADLGWTEWQSLIGTTQGLVFEDNDRFVDHWYGTTAPPTGVSYVRYTVMAENHGVVAGSPFLYFRSFGAF